MHVHGLILILCNVGYHEVERLDLIHFYGGVNGTTTITILIEQWILWIHMLLVLIRQQMLN